ncbi:hypothetical protein [Bartonella sp. AA1HLJMS]|uniref:hypothetical protein n=1 Tax=Bartonella sp. AA1HLJMS TaxID=3243424 RepID=UPI0035CED46D
MKHVKIGTVGEAFWCVCEALSFGWGLCFEAELIGICGSFRSLCWRGMGVRIFRKGLLVECGEIPLLEGYGVLICLSGVGRRKLLQDVGFLTEQCKMLGEKFRLTAFCRDVKA